MNRFYLSYLVALIIVLSGCTSMLEPQNFDQTYNKVTFSEDKYKGNRTYEAPQITLKSNSGLDASWLYGFLRLIKSDTSNSYCLYGKYEGSNWAFFDKANDSESKSLQVAKIDRHVGTFVSKTNVTEDVCIVLDREYLESKKDTGLNIKLIGQRREITFVVPAYYIQGFLKAVDLVEKEKYSK